MRQTMLSLVIAITLTSCGSTLLESKLKQNQGLNYSRLPTLSIVVKALGNTLKKSNHLIFILQPINRLPMIFNKDFAALVYDFETKNTFYFRNKSVSKIELEQTAYEANSYLSIKSTLQYYLNGQVDLLLKSQNRGMSEGGVGLIKIYDIDLIKSTSQKTELNSVFFTKGGQITYSFSETF